MSGWGNGIARPWHERPQPFRLALALSEIGWTATVGEPSLAPGGRTLLNTIEIHSAEAAARGAAWFREGSFVGGDLEGRYYRAQPVSGRMGGATGVLRRTPNQGLSLFILAIKRRERELAS